MSVPQEIEKAIQKYSRALERAVLQPTDQRRRDAFQSQEENLHETIRTALADHQALVERCERLRKIAEYFQVYDKQPIREGIAIDTWGDVIGEIHLEPGDLLADLVPAQDAGD